MMKEGGVSSVKTTLLVLQHALLWYIYIPVVGTTTIFTWNYNHTLFSTCTHLTQWVSYKKILTSPFLHAKLPFFLTFASLIFHSTHFRFLLVSLLVGPTQFQKNSLLKVFNEYMHYILKCDYAYTYAYSCSYKCCLHIRWFLIASFLCLCISVIF